MFLYYIIPLKLYNGGQFHDLLANNCVTYESMSYIMINIIIMFKYMFTNN